MNVSRMVGWVRAVALSALLLAPQAAPTLATWTAAAAGTVVFATPSDAWARRSSSSSKSSGGYSKPSSRTPSASSSSSSSSSSSGSGGYSRPRTPSTASDSRSSSASDKAFSRQGSGDALKRYRDADKPAATAKPSTSTGGGKSGSGGWSWTSGERRPSSSGYSPSRGGSWSGWYGSRYGWSAPRYVQAGRSFGMWDAVFLWFLLDSLTSPGHAAFFHNHQNDPGVQQWRAEAEKLAKDNADLKAKLAQLDRSVAQMKGQPVDPSQLPPDIPLQVATGSATDDSTSAYRDTGESGGMGLIMVVVILGGVIFLLWFARRRLMNSKPKEDSVRLGTIGNFVSQKLSGKPYQPSLFRVGMTVTIDPTPFLLAAGLTKVAAPEGGAGGLTSIPAIGTVSSGSATVHRLYLNETSFFQLHLDKEGFPTECRYFTVIDEVTPADEGEWGFWLDRKEGMIGWPEFETKDGKVYGRAWTPGTSRVKPFAMKEEIKDLRGSRHRSLDAMLYAAPTGAAAPSPEREYILVSAVDDNGNAYVEIAAGIDVSPASLSLT